MSTVTAVSSLGALSGAWAYPLHGAEFDGVVSGMIKTMGSIGTISAFIFIILFASIFIKVLETNRRLKTGADVDLAKGHINKDKLSKGVKKKWLGIYWTTIFAAIFGFTTVMITSLVNEGFVTGTGSSGSKLMLATMIFGLGGCAITLGLVIGYLIVQWPKTAKPKGGKSGEERAEDNKLYLVIKPNKVYGIVMSIFFLIPIITIMGTEFDESRPLRNMAGTMGY